ncbi:MAG: PTS sugar transporter subunit IIA [Paracoccaceae bacterium]|tara:strand:+ start:402 stop:866 length:465 start_codon:yes stop_codon:yes gene_type:complete
MELYDLLHPEAVKVVAAASSKKRVLHDMAQLAGNCYDMRAEVLLEALLEREKLGPTGVGNGVALPHARSMDVGRVCGAFILLESPVDFGSVDKVPVDVIFGLFAPENAGVDHLKALAIVSRTLRDSSICAKLRANPDQQTLFTILTENQKIQAA